MSTDTMMPSGNAPQYETFACTFPRNSMSNHVAGNVATKKMTIIASSALNMDRTPQVARNCAQGRAGRARRRGWSEFALLVERAGAAVAVVAGELLFLCL